MPVPRDVPPAAILLPPFCDEPGAVLIPTPCDEPGVVLSPTFCDEPEVPADAGVPVVWPLFIPWNGVPWLFSAPGPPCAVRRASAGFARAPEEPGPPIYDEAGEVEGVAPPVTPRACPRSGL